jgi:hypothetical protein
MTTQTVTLTITLDINMDAWNGMNYLLRDAGPEQIAVKLTEELTTRLFCCGLMTSRAQDEALKPLYAAARDIAILAHAEPSR